jgi:hypothetical protein
MELTIPKELSEIWKPNPKQELFLCLPLSIKEAMLGGGASSGKTDVLLMYGVVHRWHENPKFKQVYMRRTRPDMKKEVVGRAREIYEYKLGAKYNATDMIFTFPRPDQIGGRGMAWDGAQIFLAHCEEEKNVHNFDSMEISLFTPDELTNATEFIYLYISQERNRAPKGSGLVAITRACAMPGGVGHTFVKRRFVDPFPAGNKIIVGKGGNKRIYVHATLDDNAEHNDPNYAQSLEGRPEAERKAKRRGDWNAYLGQVFDELRDRRYPDEPENALHVIPPFEIPSWWPRFIIGDWGFTAMTYIGFYAVSPQKRLYLCRELYWLKTKIKEWAPVVKDFVDRENPRIIKFCRSASQDRGLDHTIQSQIEEALERQIELSNNSPGSRVAGKMLLHEYLRWKPLPAAPISELPAYDEEKARWIMRNKGMDEYKSYLSIFEPPKEETNIPRIQIFRCDADNHDGHPNCCPIMIDSLKACNYDKSRNGKPAEDVAEFEGDDPYDDLRYAVDTAERYFETAADEFEKIQKQEAYIQKLHSDNNWTAFYRNMERVENQNHIKPVRRYH